MKTDGVLDQFADMMISRMEKMKSGDWRTGWFTTSYGGNPVNLGGREYNGINSFFLCLSMMDEERFKYPIFATFRQIKELGASVNKGEKSFPVLFWSIQYKDSKGNKISEEDYNDMSHSSKQDCKVQPFLKSYNVFNLSQTNLEEVAPKAMQKLKEKFNIKDENEMPTDTKGMYVNSKMDDVLLYQKWLCPIRYDKYSSGAFYKVGVDEITTPFKSQFKKGKTEQEIFEDGQEYYSTLLHEMVHSTGHKSRLDRDFDGERRINDYAREELVAELGAALVGNVLGFSSRIIDNNAAYLDAWISKLKKQPKFIVSVMSDVSKAVKMVLEIVNKEKAQLLMPA